MTGARAFACVVVACGGWASSSCAPSGFQSETLIASVRILASSADRSYAKPGARVTARVLTFDGRASEAAPMTTQWLPFVCMNPPSDAYYACFQQFAGSVAGVADGGANTAAKTLTACDTTMGGSAGLDGGLQEGVDLTRALVSGDCVQFAMPNDAVSAHATTPPPATPYGLAILFNIACAGHVELVARDPNNVQTPPIGCFDAQHNRLGANDYVIGFTRIYAYDALQNANPVIDHVDVDGRMADLSLGIPAQHCAAGGSCPSIHIGPVVPTSSQEENPEEHDVNGNPLREQIWAQYFSTVGSFKSEARLLYDPTTGSLGAPSDTDNEFQPPDHAGDGTIWIVVHDNRGGVTWVTVPVHVS
ncbi:MAG: hypothetical protein M3O46_07675 [Myxococcota bacterium]|nr:hypothetical protein [Myxococcota bacterium]